MPRPAGFFPEETEDGLFSLGSARSLRGWLGDGPCTREPQAVLTGRPASRTSMWHPRGLHREYDRHEDIWLALKKGKRPGTDPRQCNRDGRLTTEACLCTWLTGLSDGEKYGLISQAASDAPLCLEGLEAVLQLGWYDMNVYIQTSTGMFSLAALVLCNHGRRSESSASEVVGRELASQEVSCTFIGHWHSGV